MPKLKRLTLFLLLLGVAFPMTAANDQSRTEGKIKVKENEISMVLVEPAEPVDLEEAAAKLTQEDWAACYLKSQIRFASNYEEWCANVSDEYRALIAPTLEKFT